MNRLLGNSRPVLFVLLVALAIGGCASNSFKGPNWFHPGTAEEQRKQAQRFDPYPDNQIAPEVVGGRPREYTNPLPAVERVQQPPPSARP
jgi:hypothetical protein